MEDEESLMAKYDEIINQLAQDPEFLDLTPDEQDTLVSQAAQHKFGVIPNAEESIKRATGGLKNAAVNFAVGGLPSMVNPTARPEETLPGLAQFGTDFAFNLTPQGRAAGAIPGVKYGATVGATTAAEGLRQGAKALRGEGGDLKEVGKTALGTAAIEGLFRGGEKALFKSQIGKDLIGKAKGRLGDSIKELTKVVEQNPGLRVLKSDIVGMLDAITQKMPKVGPKAGQLKALKNTIINDYPDELDPEYLFNIKNTLGDIATFDPRIKGELKNKAADAAAKESGGNMSTLLGNIGEYGNVPIKEGLQETSRTIKNFGSRKKSMEEIMKDVILTRALPAIGVGGATGYSQKDPVAGALGGITTLLAGSNMVKDLGYNLFVKSGASKAGRIGISEMMRKKNQ